MYALKDDAQTIRYNFYAGEMFYLIKRFNDSYGTEFAYIEHENSNRLIIEFSAIELC